MNPLPARDRIDHTQQILNATAELAAEPLPRHAWLYLRAVWAADQREGVELVLTEGASQPYAVWLPLSRTYIANAVQQCWLEWDKWIFTGNADNHYLPLAKRDRWDFAEAKYTEQACRTIGELASAGDTLFRRLFIDPRPNMSEPNQAILDAVVARFRARWATDRMRVSIAHTADLDIPFSLLYTRPDGNPPDPDAFQKADFDHFWGVRHILEHRVNDFAPTGGALSVLQAGADGVPTAFGHERLATERGETLRQLNDHIMFWFDLKRDRLVAMNQFKGTSALRTALRQNPFNYQIVYIICRASGAITPSGVSTAEPKLYLDHPDTLTADQIQKAKTLSKNKWPALLFLNACQAGQAVNFHFNTFANTFLEGGAVGLLGPVTRVPEATAVEYAQRFFRLLLRAEEPTDLPSHHVGEIVRYLASNLLLRHNNPLGLLFVLRRGADCHVQFPAQSVAPAIAGAVL